MKQIFDQIVAWVKKYKDNIIPILVLILVFIIGATLARYDFSNKDSYEPRSPEEITLEDESDSFLEAEKLELGEDLEDESISQNNSVVVKNVEENSSAVMKFNSSCLPTEKELSVAPGTKVKFENIEGETKTIKVVESVYSIPQYKYRTHTFRTFGNFEVSCNGTVVGTVVVK